MTSLSPSRIPRLTALLLASFLLSHFALATEIIGDYGGSRKKTTEKQVVTINGKDIAAEVTVIEAKNILEVLRERLSVAKRADGKPLFTKRELFSNFSKRTAGCWMELDWEGAGIVERLVGGAKTTLKIWNSEKEQWDTVSEKQYKQYEAANFKY